VRAFVETRTDDQRLVMLGEVGVGKTTLLLALVRGLAERWVAERKVVRLVTVPDLSRGTAGGLRRDAAEAGRELSRVDGAVSDVRRARV
jgi:DNA replication protein DnaC